VLELTVEDAGIRIDARIDRRPSEERAFVQLTLRIGDAAFGDPDAWALGETVARAVGDLIGDLGEQADGIAPPSGDFLRRIEPASLHAALHDWGWGSGEWRYEEDCPLGDLRPDCARNWPVNDFLTLATCSGVPSAITAAAVAALGAEVDDPVGAFNDVEVVLDDEDGVAAVDEALEDDEEAGGCPRSGGRWSARRGRRGCCRSGPCTARGRA
jgi:hypothetical protein